MPGLMVALALLAHGAEPDETVGIQVAAHDLPPGTRLRYADFETRQVPPEVVHQDVLQSPAEALHRTTREWVYAGEALRPERLLEPEHPSGLLAMLPRGMAIHHLVLPAPQGWPRAGDWVDLVHPERACLLVSAAAVLGVRSGSAPIDTSRGPGNIDHVYVALTPEQVPGVLAHEPRLLLRGPTDVVAGSLPSCGAP